MPTLRYPAVWIASAIALALALLVFALLHSHGIVHFVAHLPAISQLLHRIGWSEVHRIYWHLRHLIP